jgi:anti-sigma regulatory factor (Ser/Thr protein kinase)
MSPIRPTDVEFQIPHEGKYVAFVRRGVSLLAGGAGFDLDECMDVEVAVGEAVTNAILHGRPASGDGKIFIRCRLTPHRLVVEIEDQGEGLCTDMPSCLPGDDDEHGRGWFLMYSLMDRTTVRCENNGLVVRLVKRHRRLRRSSGAARMPLSAA